MESNLHRAWTQIITANDYDQHMAAIGQAQAAAALTAEILRDVNLPTDSRILVTGAGTGQMFDFIDPALFRHLKLICTDLNPTFLTRLRERLVTHSLKALLVADDLENTSLLRPPHLLLATLVLEHIDWLKGVDAIAALAPAACGIIIQENPAGMTSAVTPGRRIPSSMAAAVRIAHPKLISHTELLHAFDHQGYKGTVARAREVADGKRLISTLFLRRDGRTS